MHLEMLAMDFNSSRNDFLHGDEDDRQESPEWDEDYHYENV